MAVDISGLISAANSDADAASNKAVAYTDNAQLAAQGYSIPGPAITVVAPTVVPPAYDPNVQLATVFESDFNATWADLETWVRGLMTDWMNTHFPMLDPAIETAENTWLLNVVNSGYAGIPALIEQAIWDRARSRETQEAIKLEEEAIGQLAVRGFSLPPGVLADRLLTVQRSSADKVSTISRDIAIKQVELSIEMTKLAIQEMTKLRIGLAGALADFMRAWMSLPGAAADIAKAKATLQQVLWNSSADYARAQVSIASLSLDAQKTNAEVNVQLQKLGIDSDNASRNLRVQAAIQAANSMGQIASATHGAQNTVVGSVETFANLAG